MDFKTKVLYTVGMIYEALKLYRSSNYGLIGKNKDYSYHYDSSTQCIIISCSNEDKSNGNLVHITCSNNIMKYLSIISSDKKRSLIAVFENTNLKIYTSRIHEFHIPLEHDDFFNRSIDSDLGFNYDILESAQGLFLKNPNYIFTITMDYFV